MKGANTIIGIMLLVIMTIILLSVSFYFYKTMIYKSGEEIERKNENVYCSQSSNFIIKDANGKNITILNNGGTKLNLTYFKVYINGKNINIVDIKENYNSDGIMEMGESAIFILENPTSINDVVKVVGRCNTGDQIIVR